MVFQVFQTLFTMPFGPQLFASLNLLTNFENAFGVSEKGYRKLIFKINMYSNFSNMYNNSSRDPIPLNESFIWPGEEELEPAQVRPEGDAGPAVAAAGGLQLRPGLGPTRGQNYPQLDHGAAAGWISLAKYKDDNINMLLFDSPFSTYLIFPVYFVTTH